MSSLLEMATNIVAAHASTSPMTRADLLTGIKEVYAALVGMEKGQMPTAEEPASVEAVPAISKRKAFGKNSVTCMVCGREMKTLKRHLNTAHGMKPSAYRMQFDIPRTQPLAAKAYSASRKQMAIDRDLGANLAKARAARGKGKETPKKAAAKKTTTKKRGAKKAESAPV